MRRASGRGRLGYRESEAHGKEGRGLSLFLSLPIPLLHLSGAVTAGNPKEASKPLLPVSLCLTLSVFSAGEEPARARARPRPPVIAPKDSTLQQRASARPPSTVTASATTPTFPPRSHSSSLPRTGNGRADRPRRRSELPRWVRSRSVGTASV